MSNETTTFLLFHQIFKLIISSTLARVLWKLLYSIDQRKGSKVILTKTIDCFHHFLSRCTERTKKHKDFIALYILRFYKLTLELNVCETFDVGGSSLLACSLESQTNCVRN